ncbi:MAG: hypothetical protein VKP72_12980 [bacterium]|nr:hypothetical protein [bacterium]
MTPGILARGLALCGLLAALSSPLPGCANSATLAALEPVMRVEVRFKKPLSTASPRLRYHIVFNTATAADLPDPATEAAEAAGLLPASGEAAGPRCYGSWGRDRPLDGWNLPFYLSGGATSSLFAEDPRKTFSFTGTQPLLPVTWTDCFTLSAETGDWRITQMRHPNPISNPKRVLFDVRTLQRGQDWTVDGATWMLQVRVSDLLNGKAIVEANRKKTGPAGSFVMPPSGNRVVMANFVAALDAPPVGQDQAVILDRWTIAENDPGVVLRTVVGIQDQAQQFRPAPLFPQLVPAGVDADSVTLASYNVQVRQ